MSEPAVDFRGVSKAYGSVTAVDGFDLIIRVGETVALLGANGAGKSSVVSLMLGLLRPDAGTVEVLGIRPHEVVARGRIGVMLQDGGLMPGVTVRGLLGLAVALYPHNPRSVDRLLSDTGLAELSGRRVDRGGQAQRLRFAVAIAGEPDVLVLDEPTAAMDVKSRREVLDAHPRIRCSQPEEDHRPLVRGADPARRSIGSMALVTQMTPISLVSTATRTTAGSTVVGSCGPPPVMPAW
jgi:ABC-2 type transport system ATP-binding protein